MKLSRRQNLSRKNFQDDELTKVAKTERKATRNSDISEIYEASPYKIVGAMTNGNSNRPKLLPLVPPPV